MTKTSTANQPQATPDDQPQDLSNMTQDQLMVYQQMQAIQTIGMVANQFPRPTVKRRKPIKWEKWEEQLLIDGVRKFGRGNWAQIRAATEFQPCRTNVDLHDKWRVLTGERKRSRSSQKEKPKALVDAENEGIKAENGDSGADGSSPEMINTPPKTPYQRKKKQPQTSQLNELDQVDAAQQQMLFANFIAAGFPQNGEFGEVGQFSPEMIMQAMQEQLVGENGEQLDAEQLAQVVAAAQMAAQHDDMQLLMMQGAQKKRSKKSAVRPNEDDVAQELLKLKEPQE